MKKRMRTDKDGYEDDPFGLGSDPKLGKPLAPKELKAMGMPSPAEIAASLKTSKITLALDIEAITFFKEQAKKHGVPYQAMIRGVVRDYVTRSKR